MKIFKFFFIVSFVVLLVIQLQAKSFHNHKGTLQLFTTCISDDTFNKLGFPNIIEFFDTEEVEFLDDDVFETEMKVVSAIHSNTIRLTFSPIYYIPQIVIPKISFLSLFFKSWQSFLQVFRL